jgi:GNAT superfamily N-acetyltransferase
LTKAAGMPGRPVSRLVFRWCTSPSPLEDRGTWHASTDSVVPTWLRGFNGEVLVAFDDAGLPVSGVGIKKHTPFGQELAVATNPRARGRGLAAALVAQAARRVLDEGSIPIYLHLLENGASAKTAEASGFNDRGWSAFALADPA